MLNAKSLTAGVLCASTVAAAGLLLYRTSLRRQAAVQKTRHDAALRAERDLAERRAASLEAKLLVVTARLEKATEQIALLRRQLREATGSCSLLELPELPLELICQQLPPRDRWALAISCKALFQQWHDSPMLWTDLHVRLQPSAALEQQACFDWLAQGLDYLRRLHIEQTSPALLPRWLTALRSSQLIQLELIKARFCLPSTIRLPQLPALQRLVLRQCHYNPRVLCSTLPDMLPALEALECYGCPEGAFSTFSLPSPLTRLCLVDVGLTRVPSQLSALGALRELDLSDNVLRENQLGWPQVEAEFGILQHLTDLTALSLSRCQLDMMPSPLSSLCSLEMLDFSLNRAQFSIAAVVYLHPLRRMTRLTRLDLSGWGLNALPPYVSSLQRLVDLNLSGSRFQFIGLGARLEPLEELTGLVRLDLSSSELSGLPTGISALQSLQTLNLSRNWLGSIGPSAAWLQQLTSLTSLDLSGCALRGWPQVLSRLPRLQELVLDDNNFCDPLPESWVARAGAAQTFDRGLPGTAAGQTAE